MSEEIPHSPARRKPANPRPSGLGVDASGAPVIDPTANVISLVESQVLRADDLRDMTSLWAERLRVSDSKRLDDLRAAESRRVDEQMHMRSNFEDRLASKESSRVDAFRDADRQDADRRSSEAQAAIVALATSTNALKDALQKQTADIAVAVEVRQQAYSSEVNKRLASLESSQSEGRGSSKVTDPQTEKMAAAIETLALSQRSAASKTEGSDKTWAAVVTIIGLAISGAVFFRASVPAPSAAVTIPPGFYLAPIPMPSTVK